MRSKEKAIPKGWRVIIFFIYCLFVVPVTFFLIEGLSSTILFFRATSKTKPMAETIHTEYDEQLGWINLSNVYIEDMYGPGIYVKTNSQGFRNNEDFRVNVPDGKVRIICSGDSFTFGYGVDNDHSWCQLLASMDDRLQTVNMGQGAYGVDQAYLWYKRDGLKLEHNIHLFAFITNDFERIDFAEFLGYGKPLLKVKDDKLIIDNVPAPQFPAYIHWIVRNRSVIGELKSIQLLNSMRAQNSNSVSPENRSEAEKGDDKLSPPRPPEGGRAPQPPEGGRALEEGGTEIVVSKVFEDLRNINESKNSTLVLVYLPTLKDYDEIPEVTERWRRYVRFGSEELGIISIDLVDEFRKLPRYEVKEMFFPNDADYPGAAGHYTEKGNEYVAKLLYEKLLSLPENSNNMVSKSNSDLKK